MDHITRSKQSLADVRIFIILIFNLNGRLITYLHKET